MRGRCSGFCRSPRFIAHATGSPYSHTGIIAVEDGVPIVYDCSSWGIQRQPLAVWMLDSIGSFGVKRLKPHLKNHIAGVLDYCRKVYADQVPFDDEFRIDDSRLYCVEMTEKAFRSQGSGVIRAGVYRRLGKPGSVSAHGDGNRALFRAVRQNSITLDQPVYVPGNDRQGIWASPLLETVYPYAKAGKPIKTTPPARRRH